MFEGIRWEDDDDGGAVDGWLCYCGKPKLAFASDGSAIDPYEDEIFLVFVNAEGVAYNWRWEKCDEDDPTRPDGYRVRFCREVFP